MWLIFAVLLVLWVLGIHFYAPLLFTFLLLVAMLVTAAIAMLPSDTLNA